MKPAYTAARSCLSDSTVSATSLASDATNDNAEAKSYFCGSVLDLLEKEGINELPEVPVDACLIEKDGRALAPNTSEHYVYDRLKNTCAKQYYAKGQEGWWPVCNLILMWWNYNCIPDPDIGKDCDWVW